MAVLLAPEDRTNRTLNTLESRTFTGQCGLFHTGLGSGRHRNARLTRRELDTNTSLCAPYS
jgi:hypothetical protein